MSERWLPVVGYEGFYEVSDLGRVRSLPRRVPCSRGSRVSPGKVIKTAFPGVKYQGISLYMNGECRTYSVHSLVLRAFLGEPPEGFEACHWNGDCHDNRLSNLRWDTRSANRADGLRLGEIPLGEGRKMSKLKSAQVAIIRARLADGEKRVSLAQEYGIAEMTIGKIARRETWKHVA